jgi:hypothetical protein
MAESFYTTYIRDPRLWAIQRCLEHVFRKEGRKRIDFPSVIDPLTEAAMRCGFPDDVPMWAVAMRTSPGGWTILKTLTPELLADVPRNKCVSRLANLTDQLGCHGLSVNYWNCLYRIVESDSNGTSVHSGFPTIRDCHEWEEYELEDDRPKDSGEGVKTILNGQEHVFILRPEFNEPIRPDPSGIVYAESIGEALTGIPYQAQDDNLVYELMCQGAIHELEGWECFYFVDERLRYYPYPKDVDADLDGNSGVLEDA